MAAGQRKVKITNINITRANQVPYVAEWTLFIENVLGVDAYSENGTHRGTFGTAATWRAMTGTQMETKVIADVTAATNTPARDSVT